MNGHDTILHMSASAAPQKGQRRDLPVFFFDAGYLDRLARDFAPQWKSARPFPHVAIDNFLPEWVIDALLAEFPGQDAGIDFYETMNQSRFNKRATNRVTELGPFTQTFIQSLNSAAFLEFLEQVTGLEHLLTDPHVMGGGFHEVGDGGLLKIHSDNNWDPKLLLFRRVNLLLYLNKGWRDEYGGQLELWNADMTEAEARIAPISNRLVLFYNGELSHHGHPDPMHLPAGVTRKSLALYYYSADPTGEVIPSIPHSTVYKRRPGETFRRRKAGVRLFQRFLPPVFLDVWKYWRNRRSFQSRARKPGD